MEDTDTELELYEEVVGSLDYPTPCNGRSSSPVTSAYGPSLQAPSYGPIVENRRVGSGDFPSSVCSELVPQPALRHELAGHDSSAAVVTDRDGFATLAPNVVGPRMSEPLQTTIRTTADVHSAPQMSHLRSNLPPEPMVERSCNVPDFPPATVRSELRGDMIPARGLFDGPSEVHRRTLTESLVVHPDSVPHDRENNRPQTAPVTWMSAITASVNSLWKAFYERRPNLHAPSPSMMEEGRHKGPIRLEETAPPHRSQEAPVPHGASNRQEPSVTQPPLRRIWRLNSETEIPLDELRERRVSPELDLRIPPRRSRAIRTEVIPHDQSKDNRERRISSGRRRDSSHIRPVRKEVPRQFYDQRVEPKEPTSRRSRNRTTSRDRRGKRNDNRSDKEKECPRSKRRSQELSRCSSRRCRGDGSPPSSGDDEDSSDDDRHRRRDRRPSRPRRRDDSSPDSDDGSGHGDSSSEEDNSTNTSTSPRHYRIKLQKFDGTGSWESWWAHFQNCASYNRWTEHDKLAFMKGALIGNAAQVLWDTDQKMTGSLRKLVATLKSRYSGERQAEKYRAELQIRRRRSNETLSDLHQDIRRLMALPYPRLTAEAREEIACDHFTNALSDPDFALKVKERTPKSLDEALSVALRLEAWRKSVKSSRQDDDRSERPKQKARAVTKPDTSKPSNPSGSNNRVASLEAKISRMTKNCRSCLKPPLTRTR